MAGASGAEQLLLYVNSNEQPWIIRMVTHDTTSLYKNNCASCHRDDLKGTPPTFPSLVDIGKRRSRIELASIIREGSGRMPGFSHLGRGIDEIVQFLVTGRDSASFNDRRVGAQAGEAARIGKFDPVVLGDRLEHLPVGRQFVLGQRDHDASGSRRGYFENCLADPYPTTGPVVPDEALAADVD